MKSIYLFSALLFITAIGQAQPCSLRLSGHVHSTSTHENLSNATVTLVEQGKTIVTNNNGDFVFEGLCGGNYSVVITHTSFDSLLRTVTLTRNAHLDIDLIPTTNVLSEVTVSGVRGLQSTGIKKELSGRELEEAKGLSLAEALSKLNGVNMLQTGSTIAKPIIHGLHSNRILTINNGVRQEGQQWGNEHAPEIDPFIGNKLTVIKGVDELRYGSDAIGGVILVEPRALRTTAGYNAEMNALYFNNNRQYVASGIFEQQLKRLPSFTYRLQGSFKRGANLTTPGYRLNNTGIREHNYSITGAWRKEHFSSELYYSSFNTQIGIFTGAHVGNLSDLQNAIASPKPDPTFTGQQTYRIDRPRQDVTHKLLKWKTGFDVNNHKFNVLVAGQYNRRREYDIVRSSSQNAPQLDLSIYTFTQEINWEHPRISHFSGTVGVVAMQQDNSYSGRYLIPNFRSYTYGAYAVEKWNKDKWDVQAGLRYDGKNINTSRLQAASQTYTAYQFDFSTFAASFNAGYNLLPGLKVNTNISLSQRAPHVNELLTNGIHHGAGTYEVGNIFLKPEHAFNLSVNAGYVNETKTFTADLTLYRNNIRNFIFQQPKPDEPVLTIRGAFPKIVYEATDALLQGADLATNIQFSKRVGLASKFSMLSATNKRTDDWLIGMPANRVNNELTFSLPDSKKFTNTYLSLEMQNVFEQTKFPSDKNGKQDYKQPPPGYTLFNADVSTSFKVNALPIVISLAGRNILNTAYRQYLNSFRYFTDEVGRNISLRIKINFEHFY